MRVNFVQGVLSSTLFLLPLALAQGTSSLDSLPSCGKSCLSAGIEAQTDCSKSDYSCLCSNGVLIQAIAYCLASVCTSTSDATDSATKIGSWCGDASYGAVSSAGYSYSVPTGYSSYYYALPSSIATAGAEYSSVLGSLNPTGKPSQGHTGNNNDGGGGLSMGAKIGLGVGIPVALLAIGGGILLTYCIGRRRSKQNNTQMSQQPQQFNHDQQHPQVPPPAYGVPAAQVTPPSSEKIFLQPGFQEPYPMTQHTAPPAMSMAGSVVSGSSHPSSNTYGGHTLAPQPSVSTFELAGNVSPVSTVSQPYSQVSAGLYSTPSQPSQSSPLLQHQHSNQQSPQEVYEVAGSQTPPEGRSELPGR